MISISNRKSDDTIIAEFTYSYDPTYWGKNGTRTRVIENILKPDGNRISAQVDYEYDDLYRLVHEHRIAYNGGDPGVAYEYNFAYDAAGNRTQWQVVGGTTTYYHCDPANKLLDFGPSDTYPYTGNAVLTYDDKGNTLTETNGSVTTTYTWDYLNRLTQWQKTGETTQTYVYNADGVRVRVTPSGGTATNFLLDGGEVAEEITGVSVTAYIAPGLICRISGEDRSVYHADGLGSTRAMSDEDEDVAAYAAYSAYGSLLVGSASESGYAGQHRYYADATGLDYLKARYYNPAVGRFISKDPIGYGGGLNTYDYVSNNPVGHVDPSGLLPTINCPNNPNIGKVRTAISNICDALNNGKMDRCPRCTTGPKQLQCLKDFCNRGTIQCGSRECVANPTWCGHAPWHPGVQKPGDRIVICNLSFAPGQCEGNIPGHPVTDTLLHEMMHACGSDDPAAGNKAGACIGEMLK